MGYKYNLQLGVVVVMMFAVAHAQLLPPLLPLPTVPTLLNVSGILNCPSGPGAGLGIPGVTVSLNCTISGGTLKLGQGVTNATGGFSISVLNILLILPNIIGGPLVPCSVVAQLPLLNQTVCPILKTANGTIAAVPSLTGSVLTPLIRFLNFITGIFVILSVNVGLGG